MNDEPDHLALCRREQAFLLAGIRDDLDLTDHMADAVNSLCTCLPRTRAFEAIGS